MRAFFIKDGSQWLIKVTIDVDDSNPKSGDSVTITTKGGDQVEKILGELVDSRHGTEFVFTKGKRKKENIDFMNFANVDARTWYQFKKSVSKYNMETDDRIIIAHASRTCEGLVGYLITESGERITLPLGGQK